MACAPLSLPFFAAFELVLVRVCSLVLFFLVESEKKNSLAHFSILLFSSHPLRVLASRGLRLPMPRKIWAGGPLLQVKRTAFSSAAGQED